MVKGLTSVIIVTWNNEDTIRKCVESINNNIKNIEVIVVDNNSDDLTLEVLDGLSYVKCFSLKSNTGFAYANNFGVKHSNGDYVLFLNPDVVVESDLAEMKGYLKDGIGMVSGKILNLDGSVQASCYNFESPMNIFKTVFIIGKFMPEFLKKRYFFRWSNYNSVMYPEWVMGAFMYMQRKVFFEIGGFSEDYFLYAEDMDICYKIYLKNYKIMYIPDFKVIHIGGVSEKKSSTKKFAKAKKSVKSSKIFANKFDLKNNSKAYIIAYQLRRKILLFLSTIIFNSNLRSEFKELAQKDEFLIWEYKKKL